MNYINKKKDYNQIKEINETEMFSSIIFLVVNILILLLFLCFFGCKVRKYIIKQKLFLLIIVDIFLRVVSIGYITLFTSFFNSFYLYLFIKEFIFSLLIACQIILFYSFFNALFSKKNINIDAKCFNIEHKLLYTFVFFGFIFKYKTREEEYRKILYRINYIVNILYIFCFYTYVRRNTKKFFSQISDDSSRYLKIKRIINNFQFLDCLFFNIYYILKIITLYLKNDLYIKYIDLASVLPKEIGKYLCFISLGLIYYVYNKYFPKETEYTNDIEKNVENNAIEYHEDESDNDEHSLT